MPKSKNHKKTLLFVYHFSHNKSVDFIYKCINENIDIDVIVGCDYIKIKKPEKIVNFHKQNVTLEHPKYVAKKFDIPYFNCSHNGHKIQKIIKDYKINFGIIAGARILHKKIIQCFSLGILNFHPGLLPESRGLDSILWSIYNRVNLGVTAHLINEKIDLGQLVLKKDFFPSKSDTIFDIYHKIYQLQLKLLPVCYNLIDNDKSYKILKSKSYNTYMPKKQQIQVLEKLKSYIEYNSKL